MKQIRNTKNQSGFIDPEKVYFVEKFGYLLKKIDSGFGGPVQDALIHRIYLAVDKFKDDLPNVVKELEKSRLRDIGKKKTIQTPIKAEAPKKVLQTKPVYHSNVQAHKTEEKKTDPNIIKKNVIETEIEIDIQQPFERVTPVQKTVEYGSSILQPSAALIREENRNTQLKLLQKKEEQRKKMEKSSLVYRPKAKPKKEMTVWEKAWNRYGGYSEELMNGQT